MSSLALAATLLLAPPAFAAEGGGVGFDPRPQAAPATVGAGRRKLSVSLRKGLRRVARELSKTESGRHLLALTAEVPVVERVRLPGPPVWYAREEGGEPARILIDRDRAEKLTLLDFEVLFVRERWRALAAIPIELVDAEMAARQAVLTHVIEKTEQDPDFAARLRPATAGVREMLEARRKQQGFAEREGEDDPIIFPGPPPGQTLARLAYDIYLFSEDPYAFYATAAETAYLSKEAVTLDEVSDFIDLHGTRLDRIEYRAGGRYALVEGRLYPGRVGRAAERIRDREGVARLAESLGPFRTLSVPGLLLKVNAWLRSVP